MVVSMVCPSCDVTSCFQETPPGPGFLLQGQRSGLMNCFDRGTGRGKGADNVAALKTEPSTLEKILSNFQPPCSKLSQRTLYSTSMLEICRSRLRSSVPLWSWISAFPRMPLLGTLDRATSWLPWMLQCILGKVGTHPRL